MELDEASHVASNIDLGSLQKRATEFQQSGQDLKQSEGRAVASGHLNSGLAASMNQELMRVEHNWCTPEGIPGRPWFKHSLYAARYTYAHLELPGLTEAAEAGDWKRAEAQARILEDELVKNTMLLKHVRQELDSFAGAETR
jgi:N-acetylated-alpha-linked acidic dipeptidase